MIRKELKFALPASLGALVGLASGAFLLYLIVGTAFGLVWGYGDHMLKGGHPHHKHAHARKRKAKRTTKRKTSKRKRRK